jgi:hypothetical protein
MTKKEMLQKIREVLVKAYYETDMSEWAYTFILIQLQVIE